MFAFKRSLQKVYTLISYHTKNPQTLAKTCSSITNWSQKRKYSVSNTNPLVTKADVDEFFGTCPRVVAELTKQEKNEEFNILNEHFAKLLEYVLPYGKKFRGLLLVGSYKMLEKEMTEEKVTTANIAGWIVELFHTYFIVLDDIVDNAESRRGIPCWYKKPEVGLTAITDAIYIFEAVFFFLKKYFRNHKNFLKMMDLLHESALEGARGQVWDSIFSINGKPNLCIFTMSKHKIYSELKTSHYSIYMPVLLAMLMSEFPLTEAQHQQIFNITMKLGHFYQIRDDYVDIYGENIGKIGNDIAEGKCSWLVIKALEMANSKQRKLIEKYYGVSGAEAKTTIKNLYDELNLQKIYKDYKDNFFNEIYSDIRSLPKELPHELFVKIAVHCKERDASFVY